MVLCDLQAQGLENTLTNIKWYWNGVLWGTGGDLWHGCSSPGTEVVQVTYTQAGQNVSETARPGCNVGGSQ
jgi:hypothetical protein